MLSLDQNVVDYFKTNGFAVVPGFLSPEEVTTLKVATKDVVQKYCKNSPVSIFGDQSRDTYFAESGDKIRGFYEEGVVDSKGAIISERREEVLNKIGHALHKFIVPFNEATFSPKVKEVIKGVTNMRRPTVIQSMVIFKNPKVGGVVKPHQDSSYLFCEPTSSRLLGFWIALDEATTDNGCLHFLPGSHKLGRLYQRFIRNPDKSSDTLFIHSGDDVPIPASEDLVAAPCKPGDLVLIDGLVIHQSEPNTSDKPRLAFTFHIIDGNAKYSPENWLQPTEENTFMKLNAAD